MASETRFWLPPATDSSDANSHRQRLDLQPIRQIGTGLVDIAGAARPTSVVAVDRWCLGQGWPRRARRHRSARREGWEEKSRAFAAVIALVGAAVSIKWRNRWTSLQKAQWARLEDQGWTLALIGRDGRDILVSAIRGGERASLVLRKDGTVDGLSAEQPIVRVPAPSVRYLSESDGTARKLGY